MLLMDVDGVLTDGGIILGNDNQEFKIYDVQDGMGVTLARLGGLKVGFLTGRTSEVVDRRAEELHVDICYQGASSKLDALRNERRPALGALDACGVVVGELDGRPAGGAGERRTGLVGRRIAIG